MLASISASHARGDSIGTVSLLLGFNDLTYLLENVAYQNASPSDQKAMFAAVVDSVQADYVQILNELKAQAPEAKILLLNYYNPYPASQSPEHGQREAFGSLLNPDLQQDASTYGATYVDIHSAFVGREQELTSIGMGDIHPNQAGYAVIAQTMEEMSVPEPASILGLASGILIVAGSRWRRQKPGSVG